VSREGSGEGKSHSYYGMVNLTNITSINTKMIDKAIDVTIGIAKYFSPKQFYFEDVRGGCFSILHNAFFLAHRWHRLP
jgi:hypothetical protein